jgi:Na+/melibiose symporter-like transporter
MLSFTGGLRAAMWVAVIPAVLAVLVITLLVREPEQKQAAPREPPDWGKARELPARYWLIVAVGAIFTAARFSDSFLVLRARDIGLSASYAPMIMVVLSCVYAAGSYPAGAASDRMSPRSLLLVGLSFLIAADLVLALGHSVVPLFGGAALWGVHLALTQGVFAKIVADFVPVDLRGTGFGIFDLARGVGFVIANVVAGWWWRTSGPSAAFFSAAAFATIAGIGLSAATRRRTYQIDRSTHLNRFANAVAHRIGASSDESHLLVQVRSRQRHNTHRRQLCRAISAITFAKFEQPNPVRSVT